MAEEINPNEQSQGEDLSNWSFADESEVLEAQRAEGLVNEEQIPETETVQEEVYEEASTEDTQTEYSEDYDQEDLEGAVLDYISERLGYQVESLEQLQEVEQQQAELDERIEVIMDFVEQTGRDPQDWFVYQQLNPAEMDDVTAIQVDMAAQYPNLSQSEVNLLIKNKYNADPDNMSEEQLNYVRLQVKLDAEKARQSIEELRSGYMAPERQTQYEDGDLFDDQWMSSMRQSVDDFQGIEFDLGNDKTFRFGLGDQYKATLANKQARLDEYFDPYVNQDGSWDYDTLNMHRTLLDNFDTIAKSIYQQGMSDGKRGIVDQAANVSVQTPNQGTNVPTGDPLTKQLTEIMANQNGMKFL